MYTTIGVEIETKRKLKELAKADHRNIYNYVKLLIDREYEKNLQKDIRTDNLTSRLS